MSQEWFIRRGPLEDGPHASTALKQLARDGSLSPDDQVRRHDRLDWVRSGDIRGLFASPPPPPGRAKTAIDLAELSPANFPESPSRTGPPPLPPSALASGSSRADKASAVAELYRGLFESRFIGDAAVLRHESPSFGAMPKPSSANSSSAPATSRRSSACLPISFTAPASPPASLCWTRKTPPPARASS